MSQPPAGPSGRGMRNFLFFLIVVFLLAFLYFYFSPPQHPEGTPDEGEPTTTSSTAVGLALTDPIHRS